MAKNTKRTQGKKPPQQPKRKLTTMGPPRVALARGTDPKAYARMLVDPCNAELVEPLYPGAVGTLRARWRTDSGIPGSTNAAAAIAYHPVLGTYVFEAATTTTAGRFALNATATPGYAQMVTNAANYAGFRALAGCVEMQYQQSELTRGGTVGVANVPGTLIWNHLPTDAGGGNATTTVDVLRSACAHTERVPSTSLEINWVPAFGDQEFDQPPNLSGQAAASTALRESFARTNFVLLVVNVSTAAVGSPQCRFVITSAVEFNFSDGQGYLASSNRVQPNQTSFTAVLGALQSKDATWYVNAAKKAAYLVGGAARGYASGGMVGAVAGLLPAMRQTRTNYLTAS